MHEDEAPPSMDDFTAPTFSAPSPPAAAATKDPVADDLTLELDWSAYQDAGFGDPYADIPRRGGPFASAVAVCINSGQCMRDVARGVMCPSYRVRKDNAYSPGGRVRLLKKWLNHSLTQDEECLLRASMEACVACKGCKRECDSALDMASLKAEYQFQHKAETSYKLRSFLFAELPRWLSHTRLLGPLLHVRNQVPVLARLGEKWMGIRADKSLPVPGKATPLPDRVSAVGESVGEVVLLVDAFTRFYSPKTLEAAIKVISHAGYVVIPLLDDDCAGRTWFSQGQLPKARAKAEKLNRSLHPHLKEGRAIVGLEPSSLLMLREEWPLLGLTALGNESAMLFEEFIARAVTAGKLALPLNSAAGDSPVLVHGHCYEKSVGATKSMRKVLKLIPDLEFQQIEASCCGGAGSFGFEKESAKDSDAMAELGLLPALRATPEARLVTNGFSCREQVASQHGKEGVHVAELLAQYLNEGA